MSRQALIVDPCSARRARLRAPLEGARLVVEEADNGAEAARRLRAQPPDILIADGGEDGRAAGALQVVAHALPHPPPALALVPDDRPDARLAALRSGFDDVLGRGVAPRLLQARVRAALRARDALDASLRDAGESASTPGLREGRATWGAAQGPRVALLSPGGAATLDPSLSLLARLPGCEVSVLAPEGLSGPEGADLVAVDASGIMGDLVQGSEVLALLADLRARTATRDAATLVLLPPSAVATAALALDFGADAVVASPCLSEEAVHRARQLLARKSLLDRLRANKRARLRAATHDALTGLHNRGHAEPELARLAEDARRTGGGLAVLMLDIDHFKAVNDQWGHAGGDRVLREVARRLRASLRGTGLVARFGGEEFLVALPGIGAEDALATAEALRRAIEGRPFAVTEGEGWAAPAEVRVTMSVGVAHGGGGQGLDTLFERADAALYAAKRAGRNTVSAALGTA